MKQIAEKIEKYLQDAASAVTETIISEEKHKTKMDSETEIIKNKIEEERNKYIEDLKQESEKNKILGCEIATLIEKGDITQLQEMMKNMHSS